MAKLKLNLDDLKIESFETTFDASDADGTIYGQSVFTFQTNGGCGGCTSNQCGGTSSSCGTEQTTCARRCQD